MNTSKTDKSINNLGVGFKKPIIGKTVCFLLALTALTLLSACSTTETNEPKWNDFYEVRSYDIHTEVITNEIITTVFIAKYAETNLYRIPQGSVVEAVGDSFEVIPYDYEASSRTPEFQCVDGSCGVKEK